MGNTNVMLQAMGIKNPILYLAAVITAIVFIIAGLLANFMLGMAGLLATAFGFGIVGGLIVGYAVLT